MKRRKPYPVVNRLVKDGDQVREEVYRAGDPARGIPPGKYAPELARVIGHLEAVDALRDEPCQREVAPRAPDPTLFQEYGDPADFKKYNKAWTHDDSPVDAILGFIETLYGISMKRRASFGRHDQLCATRSSPR